MADGLIKLTPELFVEIRKSIQPVLQYLPADHRIIYRAPEPQEQAA